ncbi:alpha/beta hydrolase [Heyndrickxia sp. NPDC080065]|uniref:alpha/beta hydrolase n=1 Tax=Heyndrickxia sp. NPDC080065 TaxID=3390568 RepID=UPI003D070542
MTFKHKFVRMIVLSILVIGLSFQFLHHTSSNKNSFSKKDAIPTIFVHGYKGNLHSFNNMLNRFENDYYWGRKTMICRVSRNGQILVPGGIPANQKHPFVQVIFENNRARIQDTTNQLKEVMKILKNKYHINNMYAVGHSMGGLVLTNYLEQTYSQKNYPEVKKLITIGSPFKGIEKKSYFTNPRNTGPALKDFKPNSTALKTLFDRKKEFNPNISVLAIAGVTLNPKVGDGVVSQSSALAIKEIVPSKQFQERIVKDKNTTHSGLHEHQTVDRYIGEFLWGIEK